ncbi:MAG TPA: universal stress protein [Gaiellaceae bacterium]|jgi:nucleotide-binding universal stress UspA family protein|nr:universal stress protein [Gaiellaceae bacterium]
MFRRIVCGVDGSPAGLEALRQARRLLAPGGRLVAVTACEDFLAVHAGLNAPRVAAELRAEAARTKEAAARELTGLEDAEALVVRGRPADVLRRAVAQEEADLVAVGSHGTGRALGMLLGSVATTMLHEAPCSVLLARRADEFPGRVLVGADGSEGAAQAEAVARSVADSVQTISAAEGRNAVGTLEAASAGAGLLVLGSRGLRGVAALGSVGERVAHRARCSVLVVRQPPPAATKTTNAA